jgi:hypothetical protein
MASDGRPDSSPRRNVSKRRTSPLSVDVTESRLETLVGDIVEL